MQLTITGHHIEITPAIKNHIEAKMQHVREHYQYTMEAHVVLTLEKGHDKDSRHQAEVNLRIHGKVLHATATEPDMYVAIDAMVSKIERQLAKYKINQLHG